MDDIVQIIIAVGGKSVELLPLFLTFVITVAVLNGVTALKGLVTSTQKGAGQGLGKKARDVRDRSENRRKIRAYNGEGGIRSRSYRRKARKNAVNNAVQAEANRQEQSYIADQAQGDDNFRNKLAGGTGRNEADDAAKQRALASAINIQAKVEADEVNAASAVIKAANLPSNALQDLSKGIDTRDSSNKLIKASEAMQIAAVQKQSNTTVGNINELLDHASTGQMSTKVRQAFADSLQSSSAKPAYMSAGSLEELRQGESRDKSGNIIRDASGKTVLKDSKQRAVDAINDGAYSKANIADADKDEIKFIANTIATNPGVKAEGRTQVRINAAQAMRDPRLNAKLGKSHDMVMKLRDGEDPGPL